ncbi:unnamed protein product, partial [Allacma fusca]
AIQSTKVTTVREAVDLEITTTYHPSIQMTVKALVINKIGGVYPCRQVDATTWNHIPSVGLADPTFNQPGRVQVLFSTDFHYEIIRSGVLRGKSSESVAQESVLGWLIGGGSANVPSNSITCNNLTTTIDDTFQKFWDIEHLPTEQVLSQEEQDCENH